MGNSSSHNRTKAPKQPCKERPPDMDQAQGQQLFSHFKQKKPNVKIVLLFPLARRQQRTEAAAGPRARAQQPNEGATGVRAGLPASSTLRGAGDGPDRRQRAHRCELKVQVLLLQLDAWRQEEGQRVGGGARARGGTSSQGAGPKPSGRPQRLFSRPVTPREADAERDHREQRRRCIRCIRARP
ncbi:PREDICTED: uncharacterized protein C20orf144 homolog [Chinchilla lanigera]|uniref:uncharacterized protein C20orf144 homolog n=1 Tax=Chinchilla lanigera TaxID=34839 RepID=UPI00038EF6E3|nr:PREDICTED: uncharacterized protein C20orf144 homolog [Chinchilla lanigera]